MDLPRNPTRTSSKRRGAIAIGVVVCIASAAFGALADRDTEAAGPLSPVREWPPRPRPITAPDSALLNVAAARGDSLPKLRSMVVSWRGRIALERYYGGATRTTPANIKSASKSVISALIGIAIARGDLKGPRQTIGELLQAEARDLEPRKKAITIADLLTMRAGIQSTSFENYGSWVGSRNWVRDALRRPMVADAGDRGPMVYSTGSSHLLSAILTEVSGISTHAYADRYLFRPLGIRLRGWTTDPQGIYFGGNEMRLTPREMLAFGELFRNGGAVPGPDGRVKQVVPRVWIDSSWVPRTQSSWSGNEYGYGWWMTDLRGFRTYFAWGYGGQYIFVIPALETTIVVTSDPNAMSGQDGHRARIFGLIVEQVLPAVGG